MGADSIQPLLQNYILLAAVVFIYVTLCFGLAVIKKRNDIADIAWGLGFLLVAATSYWLGGVKLDLALLVTILVAIWSLRLAGHIYLRHRGRGEDARYAIWRTEWGKWFYIRSYLQVFLLQGFLLLLVVSPVVVVNTYRYFDASSMATASIAIGLVIWLVGFGFESIGDWQLSKFIKLPSSKGQLMHSGLWRYTRHPNYFGEVSQWWGLWIVALAVPFGWLAVVGPLTISILILKVSGVPMLEKLMSKNPDFADYKKHTSMFVPMPFKK